MYLVHTPKFIQTVFPKFVWQMPDEDKVIYLTFDDGPIPEVTPWVMKTLEEYNAKATFFCVGQNVEKHPQIFQDVLDQGHSVGNHTYNHLSGWATDNIPYFQNVRKGASLTKSILFRPPYGRIKPIQVQFLKRYYQIIMWDVLSGDFDPEISEEQVYQNVINNARPGSIIVFHDSLKSYKKLKYALPKVLAYFASLGYQFKAIEMEMAQRENFVSPTTRRVSLVESV